jgi:putative lipoic acid-binding regulatory protein
MSDHRPPAELLEASHSFPGVYTIKAIGSAADEFERRVVEVVVAALESAADLEYTVRQTPGGRHVAVSLEITARSGEHVREIYDRLRTVEGMKILL